MRKILVENIKGNEILAKSIFSNLDTVLMQKGTKIKEEYSDRLKELNIDSIYVEDEISKGVSEEEMTETLIKEQCQSIVEETMRRYAYSGNKEFEKLKVMLKNIIEDLLSQPVVMFNISGVRQKNEAIYSHSLNVCALSVFLALRLELPKKKISEIAMGAILHDIGYVDIAQASLQKKHNDYTKEEIKALHMHVINGYSIVEKEKWISRDAKEIILSHHEMMDGSGYPLHLKGDKLKIGTKIVAVCDSFDNLVYGNYVELLKVHEAIETIVALGGKKFDFEVIRVFNESIAAYPVGILVKTSENEIGIVLRQNNKCPTRPVIRILRDEYGNIIQDWVEKDLTKELTLFIKETVDDY